MGEVITSFGEVPTTILAHTSTADALKLTSNMNQGPAEDVLSGALTADTFKTMVSLSSSGYLKMCGVQSVDATSRTLGLRITIDGTVVYNQTSAVIATTNSGFWAVGYATLYSASVSRAAAAFENIRFNSSLVLEIKSSLTETDKIALSYSTVV